VKRTTYLLVAAALTYLAAAWQVSPGFYDGFTPQQPYNWVCPPVHVSGNQQPTSGHLDIKVLGGVSDANVAFTDDAQVLVDFLPGAFDATGKTTISVDIKPVSPCPKPTGLTFATNAYVISADTPLVKTGTLVMRYSDIVPAPSNIYHADSPDGPWKSIPVNSQAQPFTIDASINTFGYYAAGYPAGSVSHGSPNSQLLPIAVAILIAGVLVAGIPLAIVRRRRGAGGVEDDADEEETP
jgi:hypothetical protein